MRLILLYGCETWPVRVAYETPSAYRVAEQNGFRRLTEIINDAHNRLRRYADEIDRARNKLQGSISEEHLADLQSEISNNIQLRRSRTRSRLQEILLPRKSGVNPTG